MSMEVNSYESITHYLNQMSIRPPTTVEQLLDDKAFNFAHITGSSSMTDMRSNFTLDGTFIDCENTANSANRRQCDKRRYKTELCKKYLTSAARVCEYGDKCQFAHGTHELRLPSRSIKYKTENCGPFHSTGICPYGRRCDFIHNETTERLAEIRYQIHLYHEYRRLNPDIEDVPIQKLKEEMTNILKNKSIKQQLAVSQSHSVHGFNAWNIPAYIPC